MNDFSCRGNRAISDFQKRKQDKTVRYMSLKYIVNIMFPISF